MCSMVNSHWSHMHACDSHEPCINYSDYIETFTVLLVLDTISSVPYLAWKCHQFSLPLSSSLIPSPPLFSSLLLFSPLFPAPLLSSPLLSSLPSSTGLLEVQAGSKALEAIQKKRSFIITRSTFPGSGQYTGHWTGEQHPLMTLDLVRSARPSFHLAC